MPSTTTLHFCTIFLISIINVSKLETPCPDLPRLSILPGVGWNALTNTDKKQVLQTTHNKCKPTKDQEYLLPDNAIEVALNPQEKLTIGEIFDHWSTYTSPTSTGFKVPTPTWPEKYLPLYYVSSDEYQQMKSLQIKHKAFTCRSQLRQVFYRIRAKPDSVISESVKQKFLEVLRALNRNDKETAMNLAKNIVSEYGTHYSTSVDIGTVIVKEDYLKKSFYNAHLGEKSSIISACKVSLLKEIGFSWKDNQDADYSLVNDYNDALLEKKMRYFGGRNEGDGIREEDIVVIDRSGDLLSGIVSAENFPRAPSAQLSKLRRLIDDVIQDYYKKTIRAGCTQPKSTNFDADANLDDGTCKSAKPIFDKQKDQPPINQYFFGGTYQTCEKYKSPEPKCPRNSYFYLDNPLTGSTNCPSLYTHVPIFTAMKLRVYKSKDCQKFDVFRRTTFACISNSSNVKQSYLFGGLYSSVVDNVHTGNKQCPQDYKGVPILDRNVTLCVNNDSSNRKARMYALPFGGFASSQTEYLCPIGYEKHFAIKYHDENIYYCLHESYPKK